MKKYFKIFFVFPLILLGNCSFANSTPLTDSQIEAGEWPGGNETKIRYTFDNKGIAQIKAFGFRKDLPTFNNKSADLNKISKNIKEKTNDFLAENNVTNLSKTYKDNTDAFADGENINIEGAFVKIISEGIGITATLLKTGEVEEKVYKTTSQSAIKAPGLVTGSVEVVSQKVTDLTGLATMAYDIAVDKETRSEIHSQFVTIKNEIGEDPKAFVPILFDVVLSVTTGNSAEEWKATTDGEADNGKRTHLATRGTGNAIITVMAGAAIVKNLPEIAEKLAENIKKVKNLGKFLSKFDKKFVTYVSQFDNAITNPLHKEKVWRVMREDQSITKPIIAKNTTGLTQAGTPFTVEGHVATGSRTESPYISSFTNKEDALRRAMEDGNLKVVEIDLTKFDGKFIDLSDENVRRSLISNPRTQNFAAKSSEFLIVTDEIPINVYNPIN